MHEEGRNKFRATSTVSDAKYKVWTILRVENGIRVDCNGELVFDFDASSCTSDDIKNRWSQDVNYVRFDGEDKASEKYRVGSLGEYN